MARGTKHTAKTCIFHEVSFSVEVPVYNALMYHLSESLAVI